MFFCRFGYVSIISKSFEYFRIEIQSASTSPGKSNKLRNGTIAVCSSAQLSISKCKFNFIQVIFLVGKMSSLILSVEVRFAFILKHQLTSDKCRFLVYVVAIGWQEGIYLALSVVNTKTPPKRSIT